MVFVCEYHTDKVIYNMGFWKNWYPKVLLYHNIYFTIPGLPKTCSKLRETTNKIKDKNKQ